MCNIWISFALSPTLTAYKINIKINTGELIGLSKACQIIMIEKFTVGSSVLWCSETKGQACIQEN